MRRMAALLLILASCGSDPAPASFPDTALPSTTTSTSAATAPTETTTSTTDATTTSSLLPLASLAYEVVAEDLPFPVALLPDGDGSLLATKDGRVWRVTGSAVGEAVLDIRDRVRDSGEQGLLGLAVRGDRIYLHYSALDGDTVVSEFDQEGEERMLLRLDQPASNHNGGMIQFGPGGSLYVGLGDGGGAGDRYGHGQNTSSLLGGIVKIDTASGDASLWSYGLRNPWRFWFDDQTLYIGDVGQNAFEEIDVVAYTDAGFNFGWPITEGLHCFSPRSGCETEGLTPPVVEVEHGDAGTCSITGGIVYRGTAIPELAGHYFYSDYCGGWLRSFRWDGSGVTDERDWTDDIGVPGRVVSFGVGGDGEMYVLTDSAMLKVVPVREG